jgi:RNA polymerase sigma factor (sigma-70 family)
MPAKSNCKLNKLWELTLLGDDNAFEKFYYQCIYRLLAYGRRFTGDEYLLKDSIQDIFIDLYEKKSGLGSHIENPLAYLMASLRHSLIKKNVKSRKALSHSFTSEEAQEFSVEYSFQEHLIGKEITLERYKKLKSAITGLSAGQKEVIYLRFEQGLQYPEIAKIMNINVESARKQLHRAIVSLRKIIDNQMFLTFFSFLSKKVDKSCPY